MPIAPNPVTRPFDGMTSLLWTYGNAAGGLNSGGSLNATLSASIAQRNTVITRGIPTNPLNNGYMPAINNSNYPSVNARGMRTPSVSLTCLMKPRNTAGTSGWCNAALLNSLINVGSDQQTDRFAIQFTDDTATARLWDWSRCEMIQMSGDASGGPVMVTMGFKSRFGNAESENPYALTWESTSAPPAGTAPSFAAAATDPGQLTYNAEWDFNNTLSDVQSWSLTLLRGQRWRARAGVVSNTVATGRVLYPADIDSGQFSGVLTVVQDAGAATTISGSGTATLRMNTSYTGANGGFQIAMALNEDNYVYPVESAFGTLTTTYSLINLATGGNPAVITALP